MSTDTFRLFPKAGCPAERFQHHSQLQAQYDRKLPIYNNSVQAQDQPISQDATNALHSADVQHDAPVIQRQLEHVAVASGCPKAVQSVPSTRPVRNAAQAASQKWDVLKPKDASIKFKLTSITTVATDRSTVLTAQIDHQTTGTAFRH